MREAEGHDYERVWLNLLLLSFMISGQRFDCGCCVSFIIIITAVISIALQLTDKGEHIVLYKINKNARITI